MIEIRTKECWLPKCMLKKGNRCWSLLTYYWELYESQIRLNNQAFSKNLLISMTPESHFVFLFVSLSLISFFSLFLCSSYPPLSFSDFLDLFLSSSLFLLTPLALFLNHNSCWFFVFLSFFSLFTFLSLLSLFLLPPSPFTSPPLLSFSLLDTFSLQYHLYDYSFHH